MDRLLKPTILDHGLYAEHDMPCSVCLERHAVYVCGEGRFEPCWTCQHLGWETKLRRLRWGWWPRGEGWRDALVLTLACVLGLVFMYLKTRG